MKRQPLSHVTVTFTAAEARELAHWIRATNGTVARCDPASDLEELLRGGLGDLAPAAHVEGGRWPPTGDA